MLCLLLHPGLKPFLFTWKQWWCHCYINRGLLCSVFQPGLWVNGMACLVIQTCFWKKSGMSPNTTWLVLKRKEYLIFTLQRGGNIFWKKNKYEWIVFSSGCTIEQLVFSKTFLFLIANYGLLIVLLSCLIWKRSCCLANCRCDHSRSNF